LNARPRRHVEARNATFIAVKRLPGSRLLSVYVIFVANLLDAIDPESLP
jgi:hypothetical protein